MPVLLSQDTTDASMFLKKQKLIRLLGSMITLQLIVRSIFTRARG